MADRVEQFASRFVPKVEILTALLATAQRWAKIDPHHPDAVRVRKEIAKIDSEFTRMLNDLVQLVQECQPYMDPSDVAGCDPEADQDYETRIAPALSHMTAAIKECTKQKEQYAALSGQVEESDAEFLIGSGRFFC
jgi:primosomal protein N''